MAKTTVPQELSSTPNITDNGTATAITIDSSQNVGIGTSSPTDLLSVGTLGSTASPVLTIGSATNGQGQIYFGDGAGAARYRGYIEYAHSSDYMAFGTEATERMRIDSSGDLLVGTTSSFGSKVNISNGSSNTVDYDLLTLQNGGENGANINFDNAFGTMVQIKGTKLGAGSNADDGRIDIRTAVTATLTGGVRLENGGTSWGAISDENKKTDLVAIENGAEKVKTLRAVTGRYKTDSKDRRRVFLIAQDVQKVLPEAVSETEDDGETSLLLYYTDTIPLLTAALQEAIARIETLEAEVTALKGA